MTWPSRALFLRLSVCQSDRSNLSEEDNANRPTFLSLFYQRPNTTTAIKSKGAAKNVWSAKSSQGFWDFCQSFSILQPSSIEETLQIKSKVAVNMKWRRHAAFVDVSNWTRTICRAAGKKTVTESKWSPSENDGMIFKASVFHSWNEIEIKVRIPDKKKQMTW